VELEEETAKLAGECHAAAMPELIPMLTPPHQFKHLPPHSQLLPPSEPLQGGGSLPLPKGAGVSSFPRRKSRSWGETLLDLLQQGKGPDSNSWIGSERLSLTEILSEKEHRHAESPEATDACGVEPRGGRRGRSARAIPTCGILSS